MKKCYKLLFLNAILATGAVSTPVLATSFMEHAAAAANWVYDFGSEMPYQELELIQSKFDPDVLKEYEARRGLIEASTKLSTTEKQNMIEELLDWARGESTRRKSLKYRAVHKAGDVAYDVAEGTGNIISDALFGASFNKQGQRIGESIAQNVARDMVRPIQEKAAQMVADKLPPRVWFESPSVPKTNTTLTDLMYSEPVLEQLEHYLEDLGSANAKNEGLPNLLLYGPSGTGKSAFAKLLKNLYPNMEIIMVKTQMLAASADGFEMDNWMTGVKKRNQFEHLLSYVDQPYKSWSYLNPFYHLGVNGRLVSGWSMLSQIAPWESSLSSKLNYPFLSGPASYFFETVFPSTGYTNKKIGLIHDEAEILLTPRNGQPTEEINAFLQKQGTLSPHFFSVFCTNNAGKMDRRALNRFPHSIAVTLPDAETRLRTISYYVKKRIKSSPELSKIKEIDNLFDPEYEGAKEFIEASSGLAGRHLQDVANAAVNRAHMNIKKCKLATDKGRVCTKQESDRDHAEDIDPAVLSAKMILAKVQFEHAKVKDREDMAKEQDMRDIEAMRKDLERAALHKYYMEKVRIDVDKQAAELAKKEKAKDKDQGQKNNKTQDPKKPSKLIPMDFEGVDENTDQNAEVMRQLMDLYQQQQAIPAH